MGAIMAVGVAVANAILLVTFAERTARPAAPAAEAAVDGASDRLRPILMTSCAMIAGMVPMALGLGEGGEQTAPLGRAVIGGLARRHAGDAAGAARRLRRGHGLGRHASASLDPDDPEQRPLRQANQCGRENTDRGMKDRRSNPMRNESQSIRPRTASANRPLFHSAFCIAFLLAVGCTRGPEAAPPRRRRTPRPIRPNRGSSGRSGGRST